MMDFYFNQIATLEVKTGVDDYNQPTYAAAVNIPCRMDYQTKMVRNATGQEIVSDSTLYTDVNLKSDDRITFGGVARLVIWCKPMTMLDGSTLFYEVTL